MIKIRNRRRYIFLFLNLVLASVSILLFQNCSPSFKTNIVSSVLPTEEQTAVDSSPASPALTPPTSAPPNSTPPNGPLPELTSDVQLSFPPPNAATSDPNMIVRGSTRDGLSVDFIKVNGVSASTSDSYRTWKATVPLVLGNNTIQIQASISGQVHFISASQIQRFSTENGVSRGVGSWDLRILGVAFEPTQNRFILAADGEDGVEAVDAVTGNRTFLSDSEGEFQIGTGYEPYQPRLGVAYGQKSFTVEGSWILFMDLVSGNRSQFVQMKNTSGEPDDIGAIAITKDGTTIYANSNSVESSLYKINALTGDIKVISSKTKGTGPDLRYTNAHGFSEATQTSFVSQFYQDSIIAIDHASGSRRVFSQAQGSEDRFSDPQHIIVDDKLKMIYVWDTGQLYSIDMQTGRRKKIATAGAFKSFNDITDIALSPYGLVMIDFIPFYVTTTPQRGVSLIAIDPIEGTRVIISR